MGIPLRLQSEAFLPLLTLGPDPHGPPAAIVAAFSEFLLVPGSVLRT